MTAFLAGLALGALITFGACYLWAFKTMHPHDELSDLERYAIRAAKRAEGVE